MVCLETNRTNKTNMKTKAKGKGIKAEARIAHPSGRKTPRQKMERGVNRADQPVLKDEIIFTFRCPKCYNEWCLLSSNLRKGAESGCPVCGHPGPARPQLKAAHEAILKNARERREREERKETSFSTWNRATKNQGSISASLPASGTIKWKPGDECWISVPGGVFRAEVITMRHGTVAYRASQRIDRAMTEDVFRSRDEAWTAHQAKIRDGDRAAKNQGSTCGSRPTPGTTKGEPGEMVEHPKHYNMGAIEVIDAIEEWGLGFNDGNAVKYIARAEHKGATMQDLKKALFYLQRHITTKENQANQDSTESRATVK